jgi:hypothetical protein
MSQLPLLSTTINNNYHNEPNTLSTSRRKRMILIAYTIGLGTPALCWLLVLFGMKSDDLHLDKIATVGVLGAVYAPILAFITDPGEQRSLKDKLSSFAFLWFASNAGFQFCWELPWFLLKRSLMKENVTQNDIWLWPWYAYGKCDTRYLKHNDLSLAISAMDAAIAPGEVLVTWLGLSGYSVAFSWIGLIQVTCQSWGQFYFYIGEIYNNFSNMEDSLFGKILKYGILNIPWIIFPFISNAGFIWDLAVIYSQRRQVLLTPSSTSFLDDTGMFLHVDFVTGTIKESKETFPRRILQFVLIFPWVFLLVDALVYMATEF